MIGTVTSVTKPVGAAVKMQPSCIARLRLLAIGLLFGAFAMACQAADGVTAQEVVIGQTVPLSGPLAELGTSFHVGYKAAIERANRAGGIHGRKIKLLALDDGYVVQRTLTNAHKLLQSDGVFAMSGCVGTANVLALMPVLAERGVPLFGAYTGADTVQQEAGKNVFTMMATYSQETEKLVQHLTTVGVGQIAVAFQNNAFGKSALSGTQEAMKRRALSLHGSVAIEADASNATAAAVEAARLSPQAIIVSAVGRPAIEFIRAYRKTGRNAQFLLLSGTVDIETLGRELGDDAVGIIVTQTAPSPISARDKVALGHREAMKQAGMEGGVNYTSMMGHITASALIEVLRRAGRDLTRERFIATAEAATKIDLGGYEIAFSRDQHHGARLVDISMVRRSGDGFKYSY